MFSPDSSTSPFDPDRKMSRRLPVSPSAEKSDNEGAKEREGGEYGTHPYLERMESAERQAREICECGDYSRAIAELKAKGLLETQMARVRNTEEYREVLEGEPWLERPHIREMFTELELFDVPTWKHSLRVLKTIQEELGSKLRVGEYLRQGLAKEDVTEEDLKIAAGLHDFGKIAIPKFVLHDKTTEHEWNTLAWLRFTSDDYVTYREKLKQSGLHAKDLVPFSFRYPSDSKEIALLKERGIDPTQPLGAIVDRHQDVSADALNGNGYLVSGEIARHHHSHKPIREEKYPMSLSSIRTSGVIHLFDVLDALTDPDRDYRHAGSLLDALIVLAKETLSPNNPIDPAFAALVVDDYINRRNPELKKDLLNEKAAPINDLIRLHKPSP